MPDRPPAVIPIHTAVAGRARFKVSGLYRNERLAGELELFLPTREDIREVKASALTGTLLVIFAPSKALADIIRPIEDLLKRCNGPRGAARSPSRRASPPPPTTVTSLFNREETPHSPSSTTKPLDHQPDRHWHTLPATEVLTLLDTSAAGLSSQTAADRLARFGRNALPKASSRSELSLLAGQFASAPVAMLGVSAVISMLTGGIVDAVVIGAVVMVNAVIGYTTERQAERTIESLTGTTTATAMIVRDGEVSARPAEQTVPGDILVLSPGASVPADARLLETTRLTQDESALTGESMPVSKDPQVVLRQDTPLAERTTMVYMGTVVTSGSGIAAVVETGRNTEIGTIQALVGDTKPPETPMQRQLDQMGTQLALLSSAVCGGVFLLGLLRGYGWLEMLKMSISLAVAAVPEGLPTIGTTTLALGIRTMRRHQVLIRHLDAVETLGAVQVFCFDKTGTLTLNRMVVSALYASARRVVIDEERFFVAGEPIDPRAREELLRLFHIVTLCSESELESKETVTLKGSPTENALVEMAMHAGVDVQALRARYPRLAVRYRSEGRAFMTTVHGTKEGKRLLAVKGSPSEVLALCHRHVQNGEICELTETDRARILTENERMAGDALRVLGAAQGDTDGEGSAEQDALTWLGLVGMADPIRPAMGPLMGSFHRAGIKTIMITGDQSNTAYAIGKHLNLNGGNAVEILDSSHLEKVDHELLASLVQRVQVFARVSPAQKLKIVQALQQAGRVVAMTGDGVNDGPALKAANIGVAMGDVGSDVAQSVADVVLQDDNLQTMVVAVGQGRTIYADIRKGIRFLLATNFSEIEVMLTAVALGLPQPLNAMQLLWINLITDIFPGLALSLDPPEPDVLERPPRDPAEPIIRRADLKRLGLESVMITGGTLASFGYALSRYGAGARANTHAFTTLTVAQLLHALSSRSETHTLFERDKRPRNPYLGTALGASIAAQGLTLLLPGLRGLLGTAAIGALDALVITGGAVLPLLINEATKGARRRKPSPRPEGSQAADHEKPGMETLSNEACV